MTLAASCRRGDDRARHAKPLIVDPQFRPEDPIERDLRRRVLDERGLPYVWVELDPAWRIHGDMHPDPRAAHAIAVAIANRLRDLSFLSLQAARREDRETETHQRK